MRALIDAASKGGNILLNVGPTPEGTIQPEFEERLRRMGKWLETNGESICGATYGPLRGLPFGRMTAKGKALYLHAFDWLQAPIELKPLPGKVVLVSALAGGRPVKFWEPPAGVQLDPAGHAAAEHATVFAIGTKESRLYGERPTSPQIPP